MEGKGGLIAKKSRSKVRLPAGRPGSPLASLQTHAAARQLRKSLEGEIVQLQLTLHAEYWFAVAFESRAQKEAFLAAVGGHPLGDKCLDGCELAEGLGLELPEASVPYVTEDSDPKLNKLALPLEMA
jgi:hypothetical protein